MRETTSLLLMNGEGKILLQLRDNIPTILFPGTWDLWGGGVEGDEDPLECMVREVKEEIDYDLLDPQYLGATPWVGHYIHCFLKVDPSVREQDITVLEGERAAFFTIDEALKLPLGFNTKDILLSLKNGSFTTALRD